MFRFTDVHQEICFTFKFKLYVKVNLTVSQKIVRIVKNSESAFLSSAKSKYNIPKNATQLQC